jgi:hypothetical protein
LMCRVLSASLRLADSAYGIEDANKHINFLYDKKNTPAELD